MQFTHVLEKILGDPVNLRIFSILMRQPKGTTGRTLGSLVKTSTFKISQVLRHLVLQGILTETVAGRAHLYQLNPFHVIVKEVIVPMVQFEKDLLPGLGEKVLRALQPHPISVILYGSMVRGEDTPQSDLDLLVIYRDQDLGRAQRSDTGEVMAEIGRSYGNAVALTQMAVWDFRKKVREKNSLIRNILKEGKSIAGLSLLEMLHDGRKKD